MTAADIADYEERHKGPVPRQLRAAFYAMTGDAPLLRPDDRDGAREYLMKLSAAVARGHWTQTEWNRLRKLHQTWYKRANGLDPWFMVYGNRRQWADHGKTAKAQEDKPVFAAVHRIKEIVRGEVIKQRQMTEIKGESPEEKAQRLELVDRRHSSGNDHEEFD